MFRATLKIAVFFTTLTVAYLTISACADKADTVSSIAAKNIANKRATLDSVMTALEEQNYAN